MVKARDNFWLRIHRYKNNSLKFTPRTESLRQKTSKNMIAYIQDMQRALAGRDQALERKERELQQTREQLQASEQLVAEFQHNLLQRDKSVTNHPTMPQNTGRSPEQQPQGTSSVRQLTQQQSVGYPPQPQQSIASAYPPPIQQNIGYQQQPPVQQNITNNNHQYNKALDTNRNLCYSRSHHHH